jgi:hypothetical protein
MAKRKITPTQLVAEGSWRLPRAHDDPARAHAVRRALAGIGMIYPRQDTTGNPGYDFEEAYHRAQLHEIADELSRPDLIAIARAARLLLLVEREPDFFEWIKDQDQASLRELQARGLVPVYLVPGQGGKA